MHGPRRGKRRATTISGGDAVQVFTVDAGVDFTLTGIKIIDGNNVGNGGGLYLDTGASAIVTNSTFEGNNVVGGYGGAIYVNGATLEITNSTFTNNTADVTSLGIYSLGGGAIQNNDGTVTITGTTFNGYSVISPTADGGAIYNGDFDGGIGIPDINADTLTITNSTFYNNQLVNDSGGSAGGAIRSASVFSIKHSTFSGNDSGITGSQGGESGALTQGR